MRNFAAIKSKDIMTKERLIVELDKRLHKIAPDVQTNWTQTSKGESDWSREIQLSKGKHPADILKDIFGISSDNWLCSFEQATNGSAKEIYRILRLHSSALLALLCFHNISKQPLVIRHSNNEVEEYDQCWFEVENIVFEDSRPSSVDVVLKSSKTGNLLFLESKFTEYLSHEEPNIAMKYWDFYVRLLREIPGLTLQMVYPKKWNDENKNEIIGFTIKPTSERKEYQNIYLAGIKQCISHIIGICNGPKDNDEKCWQNITSDTKLRFGSIVYKISGYFSIYNFLYKETLGQLGKEQISIAMNGKGIYVDQIEILPELLTYQSLFKDYPLGKIAQYYKL